MEVKSNRKKRTFKGTVLFTVLAVLAMVLVLMIATIGLAGTASRRAYKEYYNAQINATGRSVVESVLQSLSPTGENPDLGNSIFTNTMNNGGAPYTVYVSNNGNLGNGLGTVEKIDFSFVGMDTDDTSVAKRFYIDGSSYPIIKVTATIRMGSETTTYSEYVTDMTITPGGGGDGGLIGTNAVSATGTGMNVLGPVGGGLNNGKATGEVLKVANDGVYSGVQFFNGSLYINTNKAFLYGENKPVSAYSKTASSNYNGLFVLGHVFFQNNAAFLSEYTGTSAKSTPYMFVTGNVYFPNGTQIGATGPTGIDGSVGSISLDASDVVQRVGNNINLYCGALKTKGVNGDPPTITGAGTGAIGTVSEGGDSSSFVKIAGSVYCYDETETSVLTGKDVSPLTNWVAELKTGTNDVSEISGSFYTKGSLNYGNATSKMCIDGSLYVGKELRLLGPNVIVKGDVSAHVLRIPYPFVSAADIAAKLGAASVEFDYVIDSDNKCFDKNGAEVAGFNPANYLLQLNSAPALTKTFPSDKELDQILGITFNTATTSGKSQLNQINSQDYTLTAGTLTNKIIQIPTEMNDRFYEEDTSLGKRVLLRSKSASAAITSNVYVGGNAGAISREGYEKHDGYWYAETTEAEFLNGLVDPTQRWNKKKTTDGSNVDLVYETYSTPNRYFKYVGNATEFVNKNAAGEIVITESCVLRGPFHSVNFRIIPGEDVSQPLWIELDGFSLENGKMIVEDIIKDGGDFVKNGVCKKAAPVYFYVSDDTEFKLNKSSLVTEFYDTKYFKGTTKLSEKLTVPAVNIPAELKPNVYIYASNNEDGTMHEKITVNNNSVLTAYIVAPRATLDVYNAGVTGAQINYNGKNYTGLATGIIGSAIVGEVTNVQNNVTLVYINNGDPDETDGSMKFNYIAIPGYASY